jgi:hypothetical protein
VIVGLWLAEHIGDGLLDQLLQAAADWARSHRRRTLPMKIQILYGPDGEGSPRGRDPRGRGRVSP